MTTILVVDDETDLAYILTRRFRQKIKEGHYQFRFVHNGFDALTLLQNEAVIDLLLLDINMPDLDGLSLLKQLPALNPLLQTVMVSAYGDMANIRTAMNLGAFDFVCKPIDLLDLERTIDKTIQHLSHLHQARQLKIIDELKTRFFDNITHEFRTPLTLILAPAQQLRHEFPDLPNLQRNLLTIDRNARQLLRLINQLLDLAKLESGQLPLVSSPGNLGEYIGQLVEGFVALAQSRQLQLSYQNDLPGWYAFDAQRIEPLIYNLVANALKFTPQGQVTIRVAPSSPEPDAPVRISVQDTGVGIAPEKLPYIFNRFYQGTNDTELVGTDTTRTGTGIGLALVHELINLHKGTITVESVVAQASLASPPSGTRFVLELPLVAVAREEVEQSWLAPGVGMADSSVNEATGNPPLTPLVEQKATPAEAPLLLLVDDSDALREFLAGSLGQRYRLLTASNGAEAWKLALQEVPDLVISDVMMPLMNGYQLTQQLKTDPATDHIAVVLLTAKVSPQSVLDGLSRGADDYIPKPFHLAELELRVQNLLSHRQKIQQHYQRQLSQPTPAVEGETRTTEMVTDSFLKRLYTLLDDHLDAALPVEWVADELAMSRKTLYRKVQSLTQLSPNELIRQYRLRRAADLLRAGQPASAAAYQVGFETPSHFAQAFKDLYGLTPTEFARR